MDVRIPPPALGELGPLARGVATVIGWATIGAPPGVFTTLGRHRRLFRSWLPFAGTMLLRTHLPRSDVELVVLRTACNCAAPYEWVQHVPLARRAGLSVEVINAIPRWQDHDVFSEGQLLLLTAVDELHTRRVLTAVTWAALTSAFEDIDLIELCMLVGHYEMLAMTLNSIGVQPEPSAESALDEGARQTQNSLVTTLDSRAG
jgi:alkylhydroperoxidase family enzyme